MKKRLIGILSMTLAVVCLLTSCGNKHQTHIHSYGDWQPSQTEACKLEKTCACGYKHVKSIDNDKHSYENYECKLCGFIEPSKMESINIAKDVLKNLIAFKKVCNDRTDMYKKTFKFVSDGLNVRKYANYDKLITGFSNTVGLNKEAVKAEFDKILVEANGTMDNLTEIQKMQVVYDINNSINVVKTLITSSIPYEADKDAAQFLEFDQKIEELRNKAALDAASIDALDDYKTALLSYYNFSITVPDPATTSKDTYNAAVSVYENSLTIEDESALAILQSIKQK